MKNFENINKLIDLVKNNAKKIPYINLDQKGNYAGWVSNFHIYDNDTGSPVQLDLKEEKDLFLLFVLASCWSRTGQWENSACFVAYLKIFQKNNINCWRDIQFVKKEQFDRFLSVKQTISKFIIPKSGAKISFRSDFYNSIKVLADHWEEIKKSLLISEEKQDYSIFISYISKIKGLGARQNKMKIKIPLLLRELRIQGIYKHIPGKWCCVPDNRVHKAASNPLFSISLPTNTTLKSVLQASEIIYSIFGDLYDIPLFTYEDIQTLF